MNSFIVHKKKKPLVFFISKKFYALKFFRYNRKKNRELEAEIVEFVFLGMRYKYEPDMLIFKLFGDVFGLGILHQIRFLNFIKVGMSFRLYGYTEVMRNSVEIFLRRLVVGYEKQQIVENFFYEKYKKNCYHSIRLKMGLPIRGQRTRSNAGSFKQKRRKSINTKKRR